MSNETVTFSIIIPVQPGGDAQAALNALANVDYAPEQFEIVLVDGKRPSLQRNVAAREASGQYLYFLDDDSEIHPDALQRAAAHLGGPHVVGVGGPNLPAPPVNLTERCVGVVLASQVGTSLVRSKYEATGGVRPAREYDVILCNMCLEHAAFTDLGGFDERLYPNEETEFFHRLRVRGGGRYILYDPELRVDRGRPRSLWELAGKIFNYGRGRMEQTLIAPSATTFAHMLPLLFVLYAGLCAVLPLAPLLYSWALYGAVVGGVSVGHTCRVRNPLAWPILVLCYVITHVGYGLGLAFGLLGWPLRRLRRRSADVKVRFIKRFGDPWPTGRTPADSGTAPDTDSGSR